MNLTQKPVVKLIGTDGNVFSLVAACKQALKREGLKDEASEMQNRVFACGSYNEALNIMMEYVDVE